MDVLSVQGGEGLWVNDEALSKNTGFNTHTAHNVLVLLLTDLNSSCKTVSSCKISVFITEEMVCIN